MGSLCGVFEWGLLSGDETESRRRLTMVETASGVWSAMGAMGVLSVGPTGAGSTGLGLGLGLVLPCVAAQTAAELSDRPGVCSLLSTWSLFVQEPAVTRVAVVGSEPVMEPKEARLMADEARPSAAAEAALSRERDVF